MLRYTAWHFQRLASGSGKFNVNSPTFAVNVSPNRRKQIGDFFVDVAKVCFVELWSGGLWRSAMAGSTVN